VLILLFVYLIWDWWIFSL